MHEFVAALKLSREKGVGASTFRRLIDSHVLPSVALRVWHDQSSERTAPLAVSLKKSATEEHVERAITMIANGEVNGYYYGQAGYPRLLKDLSEPPPVIFFRGVLPEGRFAAVVGTRKMLAEGSKATVQLVERLVEQGFVIVSGGAMGIDSVAHQTAIACGGKTIAVLATGIDIVYPAGNADLFAEIRKQGALITELMPGAKPMRSFFPTRNRLIAALAEVVAITQADLNSGAMITAAWAARLGRKIITISPATSQPIHWAGNIKLIEKGATVFTGDDAEFSC